MGIIQKHCYEIKSKFSHKTESEKANSINLNDSNNTNSTILTNKTHEIADAIEKNKEKLAKIESIKFIKEKYRNTRIIIHNDEVACYCVFRVAKSYGILEQIGYFYNRENLNSITKYNFKPENINGRFHTLFTIMEFYYEQSDNNRFEKTMGGYNFFELRINYMFKRKIKYLTNGFNYIFCYLLFGCCPY